MNILNKQSRTADKWWSSNWGLGEVLTTPHLIMKQIHVPRAWTGPLERPQQLKRDMRFDTWNVRSQHRPGSLTKVARELARYRLELVGVQEVRWGKGGTLRAGDSICFDGN